MFQRPTVPIALRNPKKGLINIKNNDQTCVILDILDIFGFILDISIQ